MKSLKSSEGAKENEHIQAKSSHTNFAAQLSWMRYELPQQLKPSTDAVILTKFFTKKLIAPAELK